MEIILLVGVGQVILFGLITWMRMHKTIGPINFSMKISKVLIIFTVIGMIWMSHLFLVLTQKQCHWMQFILRWMVVSLNTGISIMLMVDLMLEVLSVVFSKGIIINVVHLFLLVVSLWEVKSLEHFGLEIMYQLLKNFKGLLLCYFS